MPGAGTGHGGHACDHMSTGDTPSRYRREVPPERSGCVVLH
ncbi:hypothetical protein B005_2796 [Nocardiopsis alba ATCC BAA-2165]|uniref:Uncharacterized protein n=1 Tax=Nocardiopsis alba (strain ATCC BAA-2165 / BE74) TaxID=1205910 RepID=J7L5J8_NOCAA|nr:hypothetical protein B005_2796 [Nocardiopsis alba ATCC BAA-2165]